MANLSGFCAPYTENLYSGQDRDYMEDTLGAKKPASTNKRWFLGRIGKTSTENPTSEGNKGTGCAVCTGRRLQPRIESMFCTLLRLWLNTSHQPCCNIRWKDLVLNNAVEILPGCAEVSVRRHQCLRKFMCLQKQGKVLFPPKKYQTFLLRTRGLRAGMFAGLNKFYVGHQNTAKKTLLYKGSTCADCICCEMACLLQPLLASGMCYYSEAAIYLFAHSTHGPVNWQGPAFCLPVPTVSSQHRKFMFMCFFFS